MKSISVVIIMMCLFAWQQGEAQRGLYWMGGFELGGNIRGYNFQQNGTVLEHGTIWGGNHDHDNESGYHDALKTALYYRFSRHLGVEAGLMRSYISIDLHDARFQSRYSISDGADDAISVGNFQPNLSYDAKYLAAHYFFNDTYNFGAQFYLGGGVAFNKLRFPSGHLTYSYQYPSTGEVLSLTAQIPTSYVNPFIDAGLFFYSPHHRRRSFLGARYSFAPTLFAADYQNTNGNVVQYKDHVALNGGSLSFNYSWGINLTKPHDDGDQIHYTRKSPHHLSHARSLSHNTHQRWHAAPVRNATQDVLKAELLGCVGYDKATQASFWVYEKKTRYFLEKLDSSLNRVFVHELNLRSDLSGLGKHDWVFVENAMLRDKFTLFTLSGNGESTERKITIHQFSLDGRESHAQLTAFRIKGVVQNYVHVAWSTDSTKVAVAVFQFKQKNHPDNKVMVKMFDAKLQQIYSEEVNINGSDDMIEQEVALNNKGELFIIGKTYGKQTSAYHIWMLHPETRRISEINFPLKDVSDVLFKKSADDQLAVVGFTNDGCTRAYACPNTGTFYGRVDGAKEMICDLKADHFPESSNDKERSPRNKNEFSLARVDAGSQGAFLSAETFLWSGIAAAYGSVFVAELNKDGSLKSTFAVPKYQFRYGLGRPRGQGYFSWADNREGSWHMVYYDNRKNLPPSSSTIKNKGSSKRSGKELVVVSIDSLGNQTKKLLMPNDSSRVTWLPMRSFRINDHEIFMMGKKSGKFKVCRVRVK